MPALYSYYDDLEHEDEMRQQRETLEEYDDEHYKEMEEY